MSLLLVLSDGLSLRGARAALVRCYYWFQRKMPSHTTIRNWILQTGYYKLMTVQKSKEWVGMIDLSIQTGAKKCLLILGVQASVLLKGKPLTFEDVHVLHMELLEKTSGPIICEAIKRSEARVGGYKQFCHDQGADIISGTRLYAEEIRKKEGRSVSITHDIAHKIANLLTVEAEELGWKEFAQSATHTKQRLQLTQWAAFCPPSQRSKARYMNLDELVEWAKKILSHLDSTTNEQKQMEARALYDRKHKQACQEWFDRFGWVGDYRQMIQDMSELLLIGKIARQKIRTEGLSSATAAELERELQNLEVGQRADQFSGNILDFVTQQTKNQQGVTLGSTEIIESSFGKLKQLMDENTKDGFTPFVLSLAACMGKLDLETVQAALQSCSQRQVMEWAQANVGETIYSQRRRLFSPFKKRKPKEVSLIQAHGGPDYTGIFTKQVMNL